LSGAVVIFFAGRLKWCLVVRKVPKVTEDRRQRTELLFSDFRFLSSEQFTYSTGQLKGVEDET
jgi:hypothetical protein